MGRRGSPASALRSIVGPRACEVEETAAKPLRQGVISERGGGDLAADDQQLDAIGEQDLRLAVAKGLHEPVAKARMAQEGPDGGP